MKTLAEHTPFPYIKLYDIITEEENEQIMKMCDMIANDYKEEIENFSFFLLESDKHLLESNSIERLVRQGVIQNNQGLDELIFKNYPSEWEVVLKYKGIIADRLNTVISEHSEYFPPLTSRATKRPSEWQVGFNLTADNENVKPLFPHSDYRFHILRDMGYGELEEDTEDTMNVEAGGNYKGLIYLGHSDLDYTDYGTRFYKTENRRSEFEEIPFIPRNGIMFKTQKNSYHGTHFKSGYKNNRFTIIFEYY